MQSEGPPEDIPDILLKIGYEKPSKILSKSLKYSNDVIYDTHMVLGAIQLSNFSHSIKLWTSARKYLDESHKSKIQSYKPGCLTISPENLSSLARKGWSLISNRRETINIEENARIDQMTNKELFLQAILITMRVYKESGNLPMIFLLCSLGARLVREQYTIESMNDAMNIWMFCLDNYITPSIDRNSSRIYDTNCDKMSLKTIDFMIQWLEKRVRVVRLMDLTILHHFIESLLKIIEARRNLAVADGNYKCETNILGSSLERSLMLLVESESSFETKSNFIDRVVKTNPIDSSGNSILHNLMSIRVMTIEMPYLDYDRAYASHIELVRMLVLAGLPLDTVNNEQCTCLEVLCDSVNSTTWFQHDETAVKQLFKLLIENGCHIDVNPQKPHIHWRVRKYLEEIGENPIEISTKLLCLASRAINRHRLQYNEGVVPRHLLNLIKMHPSEDNYNLTLIS